jgi:hypothetical protein
MTGRRVSWTLVPLLAAGGLAAAVYTVLLPFQISYQDNVGYVLYLALGSAALGLTGLAILWFFQHIRSLRPAAAFVALVIGAHGVIAVMIPLGLATGLFADVTWPLAGTFSAFDPLALFITAFAIVLGAVVIVFPERRHVRSPAIAAACAGAVAFGGAWLDGSQHGSWFTIWNSTPLELFWQAGIAAAIGVALFVADAALPASRPVADRPVEDRAPTLTSRLAATGSLAVYLAAASALCLALIQMRMTTMAGAERQTRADIARALAAAPSASVPMVSPKPVSQMLLADVNREWLPYEPKWLNQSMEAPVPGELPPLPHRIAYTAQYIRPPRPDEFPAVKVTVIDFPNAEWAAFMLHNIPESNAQYRQREFFKVLDRRGGLVDQLWMDSFWSSGTVVVWLHCEGVPEPIVDTFIDAYLQKYPSSISSSR